MTVLRWAPYLGDASPNDPRLSPLRADLAGMPPAAFSIGALGDPIFLRWPEPNAPAARYVLILAFALVESAHAAVAPQLAQGRFTPVA